MMRFRYVARVRTSGLTVGLGAGLDEIVVAVSDPDATAEAAAMSGQDEPARDDRPVPRSPRRAWPAMVHRSVLLASIGSGVLPVSGPFVIDPWIGWSRSDDRSMWCGDGMFGRWFCGNDDPSVPLPPVLAPTRSDDDPEGPG
jgi:hypothetical protein